MEDLVDLLRQQSASKDISSFWLLPTITVYRQQPVANERPYISNDPSSMPISEHLQSQMPHPSHTLSPYKHHEASMNRIFLLQIFSNHYDLAHISNQLITNTLASGGQILTDIFIIEAEAQRDPSRAQVLADGFRILYGIEFRCASDVLAVPRLAETGNAYAGLQIMDYLGNGYEHMNEMIMKDWMAYLEERPAVLVGVSMSGV